MSALDWPILGSLRVARCQALPAIGDPVFSWSVHGLPLTDEMPGPDDEPDSLPDLVVLGELWAATEASVVAVTAEALFRLPGEAKTAMAQSEEAFLEVLREVVDAYGHTIYDCAADFARGLVAPLRLDVQVPLVTPQGYPLQRLAIGQQPDGNEAAATP